MPSFPTAILVADDGSAESDSALEAALELARATASSLSLVHVRSLYPAVVGTTVTPEQARRLREQGEYVVQRRVVEASEWGIPLEHVEVRLSRRIESAITDTARRLGIGLLVVGARGGGATQRHVLGDISRRLVREAHCSVLVVHAAQAQSGPRTRSGPSPLEGEPAKGPESSESDSTEQHR